MTSEVAVMNRLAVALAADSAVSISDGRRNKVYNTANKLFMLSNTDPVGIMVYSNGSLMGVPWEVLIKTFRPMLPRNAFATLEEYATAFISHIEAQTSLFTPERERRYFRRMVESEFADLATEIQAALEAEEERLAEDDVWEVIRRATVHRLIRERHEEWQSRAPHPTIKEGRGRELRNECSGDVADLATKYFRTRGWIMASEDTPMLNELAEFFVEKDFVAPSSFSGVVVAGFGVDDFFPVLKRFGVGHNYEGRLKLMDIEPVRIDETTPVHVGVYADSDMADLFLKGFSLPALNFLLREAHDRGHEIAAATLKLAGVMPTDRQCDAIEEKTDELLDVLVDAIQAYRRRSGGSDFERALVHVPKDELASVAASLVNLNSFKKRMSMNIESVGGPVDVAVISKGDGFIWIDRKHYFDADKNPQFMRRSGQQPQSEPEE